MTVICDAYMQQLNHKAMVCSDVYCLTLYVYSVLTNTPPHLGLLLQASSRLEEYLGNTNMAFLAGYVQCSKPIL